MKKFLITVFILFSGMVLTFAEENGHCDIKEDNYREWMMEEVRILYICGITRDQIIFSLMEWLLIEGEDLTYDEAYFLVEPVIEEIDPQECCDFIEESNQKGYQRIKSLNISLGSNP